MRLTDLRPLYERPGPWASVYADIGGDVEDVRAAIQLRARSAREQLLEQGADARTAQAVHDFIIDRPSPPGRRGLAVFAAGGEVVHSELLPEGPTDTTADWAPLPHVMPLLVQRGARIPHMVVAVDRAGADISVWTADPEGHEVLAGGREVEGSTDPITKVHPGGPGGWSQARFQRRAENTWDRNARAVAAEVAEVADRFGVELIMAAGDVRARRLLQEHLPQRWQEPLVDLETGGRAVGISPEHLDAARRAALAEYAARRRRASADRLSQELGRRALAVQGVGPVVNALSEGKVLTVLLEDHPESDTQLWIGPEPGQLALFSDDARLMGVDTPEHDRADAAMARALAATAADLVVLEGGEGPRPVDGIAALLRHA
ncbi:Vms1/Ankzf1 family peptidyl-tRNA hydrolase [Streptomyces sp. NPDC001380]|uniref:baeRF2 domain-containing protein n=1 Tax=Streptomyces sp. NPDC001380 TaxID=3364566 RepID=UPI0036A0CDDD